MPAKISSNSKLLKNSLRDLGQKIRDERKRLRISSTDVAEASEISRVTLYRIEKGEASVTMAAYLSVILALGLKLDLIDPNAADIKIPATLPKKIRLAHYEQLKRLAWQLKDTKELTPEEALSLYERNWRHVDIGAMEPKEKELLERLLKAFKRERLLV
ncbi:helix-turn-helix domain-containing protein [Bdellovibrio bacteriovorus]|uniref:helix-turn-helix domain-containing protein n=1 Tax=Bdellovibrio bacteriovorus TaxID=959 RepID=UPI0035A73152